MGINEASLLVMFFCTGMMIVLLHFLRKRCILWKNGSTVFRCDRTVTSGMDEEKIADYMEKSLSREKIDAAIVSDGVELSLKVEQILKTK